MPTCHAAHPLRRAIALPAGTAVLIVALLAPVVAIGDDTDIYAPPLDPGFEPTLMLMVDTSGSMSWKDDGGTLWRRDRLLGPLVDYLYTVEDVRVGLSTFNGVVRGGAVVHPAENLDHDICPAGSCSSVSVRTPILRDADDGVFTGDGRTELFGPVSDVGRESDTCEGGGKGGDGGNGGDAKNGNDGGNGGNGGKGGDGVGGRDGGKGRDGGNATESGNGGNGGGGGGGGSSGPAGSCAGMDGENGKDGKDDGMGGKGGKGGQGGKGGSSDSVSSGSGNSSESDVTAGLRFDRLDVPRGARVIAAHLEVVNGKDENSRFDGEIRAEASGDARAFEHDSADDFGKRTLTAAVPWRSDTRRKDERDRSPDITALIQQAVDRDDWCAGNALALIIDGEGRRQIQNHENGWLRSASLHVTYETGSVGAADACRRQAGPDALQLASEDDVIEVSSGAPVQGALVYDTRTVNGRLLGMRFSGVDLGPDDEIGRASLFLSTLDEGSGPWPRTRLETSIDSDTAGAPFDGPASLASRISGEPAIAWFSDALGLDSRIESIDLAPLVRRALADPGWRRGGDIVLTLRRTGNAQVALATSHSNEAPGPTLRIVKKLRGAVAAARPLRTSRDVLIERLQTLPASGGTPLVDAFYETAQYLIGGEVVHGRRRGEQQPANAVHRLSDPASYTGGTVSRPSGCPADDPDRSECASESIAGSPVYTAPASSQCRANQIVLVTDGEPSTSPTNTASRIRALTGETSCDSAPDSQACATDLARWLAAGGPDRAPVQVSTIGFAFESEFLEDVAREGGGRAFTANSAAQLDEALQQLEQVTVHESASLVGPTVSVSQFNRSTHRDDVYLGLFEPAGSGTLWPGNLKRYALGPLPGDGGTEAGFGLLDAEGRAATDPDTGRFWPDARSFWSSAADGSSATRGGAASKLSTNRRVLTWPAASEGEHHGARTLVPFHEGTAAITAASLGVSEAARTEAIRWMRGLDARDEDGDGVTGESRRRMGAAIHTTPTVIDYPSSAPEGRSVVFAGTQEGFLHAVDTATGRELFAFLPHELYGGVGAFMAGNPGPMRYGLDGPVTSWTSDENRNGVVDPGEHAYITVGMRRGGEHYYTLDVTDPERPSLAWTIDPSREGFEALRQSWSAMRPARLRADPDQTSDGSSVRAALVFASGYDPVNDDRTSGRLRSARQQAGGAALYLVDPHTGALLHRASDPRMTYSIPSDVSVIDTDLDGITDLLLVGDLAASLYRVDLVPTQEEDGSFAGTVPRVSLPWALTGFGTRTGDADDRRFFHPPDVALMQRGSEAPTLEVAIGSGRRDHPLERGTTDRLYMLALDAREPGSLAFREDRLHDATDSPVVPYPDRHGWFVDMERPGEKILGTPAIVDGRVLVTSYVPGEGTGGPCEPDPGTSRLLGLDAFTARPALAFGSAGDEPVRSIELAAPGIPASVNVVMNAARPGTLTVMAGTQSIEAVEPGPVRRRTYWVTD